MKYCIYILKSVLVILTISLFYSFKQTDKNELTIRKFLTEIKENTNNSSIIDNYIVIKSKKKKISKEFLSKIIDEYRNNIKNKNFNKISIKKYSEIDDLTLNANSSEKEKYRAIVYNNEIIGRILINKVGKIESISTFNKGGTSFFIYF